jgi:ribonuclease III
VLGQAVTVRLFTDHPHLTEGELAKRRAALVSSAALAEIARAIDLGPHLRLGRGEELTGGRDKSSILADTMEAIFGAVFLELGPDAATELVLRLEAPLMNDTARFGAAMDPKTTLQELAARLGRGDVAYRLTASGPDHARVFHATVVVGGADIAAGDGTSKKQAEMAAALSAVTELSPPSSDGR